MFGKTVSEMKAHEKSIEHILDKLKFVPEDGSRRIYPPRFFRGSGPSCSQVPGCADCCYAWFIFLLSSEFA
jgi:hypothetical protein